jgi:hypothetical protein
VLKLAENRLRQTWIPYNTSSRQYIILDKTSANIDKEKYTQLYFRDRIVITTITEMSKKEIRKFLMQDTFTGKLATIKKDGSPHVVPIWFVLDDYNSSRGRVGDFYY